MERNSITSINSSKSFLTAKSKSVIGSIAGSKRNLKSGLHRKSDSISFKSCVDDGGEEDFKDFAETPDEELQPVGSMRS